MSVAAKNLKICSDTCQNTDIRISVKVFNRNIVEICTKDTTLLRCVQLQINDVYKLLNCQQFNALFKYHRLHIFSVLCICEHVVTMLVSFTVYCSFQMLKVPD